MRPSGRPTKLTEKRRTEICERLAAGESLRSICADNHIPHISNVLQAVVDDRDGFREQYTRAREAAGYAHADKIVEVAYKLEAGDIEPAAARVMLDGLKWAAERQAPKQHSPRQELTGKDGGPIQTEGVGLAAFLQEAQGKGEGEG